jgi:hypothetical protein
MVISLRGAQVSDGVVQEILEFAVLRRGTDFDVVFSSSPFGSRMSSVYIEKHDVT